MPEASDRMPRLLVEHRVDLARFARRFGIRRLSVFGSAPHGDARPDSDVDLLAEFEPNKTPGLIALAALERHLSEVLGVRVDLQTMGSLNKHIRADIIAEALEIDVSA